MIIQERIPSIVYECVIHASALKQAGLVREILSAFGFSKEQQSEEPWKEGVLIKVFDEAPVRVMNITKFFKKMKINGVDVKVRTLAPKDWLTKWKLDWKPARLTKKLDVVPVWCKDQYLSKKGRDYILMDTLLSFGTGLHETTQIVSQYIEDCAGKFKTFMDIGTGTGILAMVAIKNGAESVLAIDIGDLSVEAAKDNFKVNGLKADIRLADITKFRHAQSYDFVAANLITHDLIDNADRILSLVKPGGYLAVSGISLDNLSKLQSAFRKLPLKCLEVQKGKQWSGLLYQKKT